MNRRAIRPGLVSRAAGRRRRSAARRILVCQPAAGTADRLPARPGEAGRFLLFAGAPCSRRCRTRQAPGRRAGGRGRSWSLGADRPALAVGLGAAGRGPRPVKDLLPRDVQRPPAMTVRDGLAVPEAPGMPRAARPGPEEDPVDHRPVIGAPATLRRIRRQKGPQGFSLLLEQVMTLQPVHRASR